MVFLAGVGAGVTWAGGAALAGLLALAAARHSLATCDAGLRAWYGRHHGSKVMS
jgi:hypothetical protein